MVGVPVEAAGTGVTILLVEDEVGVRAMASEHLRELGYAVGKPRTAPRRCVYYTIAEAPTSICW